MQLTPAKNMNVKVGNLLTAMGSGIDDTAISVLSDPTASRDLRRNHEQVPKKCLILVCGILHTRDRV